tara:strand:+ start:1416 stop:2354 length:939 start_codon:yes stop_codon:yes gene_type:complete
MLGINWRNFRKGSPEHLKRVVAKMQEFMEAPAKAQEKIRAKVKELTTSADTADWASAVNAIEAFQIDVGAIDLGWAAAFDEVDLRAGSKSSIDLLDVSSGLTFAKVREGSRALIYGVSGAKTTISADLYGGGVGFLRTWWDDEEWYKVEEMARDFRYKFENQRATIMYNLIQNTSAEDVAFDTNDQTTWGNAASDLIVDLDATVAGVATDSTTFLLYHHPSLKQRVATALNTVTAYTSKQTLIYNVQPISSPKVANTKFWMVAPGGKNKYLRRMDLTLLSDEDITMFAEDVVGWGRYGGYINTAQVREIALS